MGSVVEVGGERLGKGRSGVGWGGGGKGEERKRRGKECGEGGTVGVGARIRVERAEIWGERREV